MPISYMPATRSKECVFPPFLSSWIAVELNVACEWHSAIYGKYLPSICPTEPYHMRLWYFSSSVNSLFKCPCAAIQWAWMSDIWLDPLSTSILHVCNNEGSGKTARMCRLAWAFAGCLCDMYHNLMSWLKFFLISCDENAEFHFKVLSPVSHTHLQ